MFWVFVTHEQLAGGRLELDGARGRHLARVLRVRPGERGVAVLDGIAHHLTVAAVDGDRISGRVDSMTPATGEPRHPVTLLQALLPHADFEAVLESGTQVGITRFLPVLAARSVGRGGPERVERWRAVLESAAEQSHRGAIPSIDPPARLDRALASIPGSRLVVLDPTANNVLAAQTQDRPLAIAVGPEGGWTEGELDLMRTAGGDAFCLGPRILRARLAGVVAAAILAR
jgi:16S rRNA (uracil1498-N3)-methyltransferase